MRPYYSIASRRARLLSSTTSIIAGVALSVAYAGIAQAQESGSAKEIVVTGSRIAQQGAYDAPTPVTVVGAQDIKLSGAANVENVLNQTPQFVAATNGGSMSNVVPGGQAFLNMRGLGQARNLVLVNGRRFTAQGTDLTTDINTIPAPLIERTEIVTGGSSAVYGSDAIAGVVNFIMRRDFDGVEFDGHYDSDSVSETPTYSTDLTMGTNFGEGRGNVAVSIDYLNRGSVARSQVPYAAPAMQDGCVTPGTLGDSPGTPVAGNPTGAACLTAGGVMGFIKGGSSDIPNGRFAPISAAGLPGGANAALNTAYANAGLSGISNLGWTWNDTGTTPRAYANPGDLYNNSLPNYLQVPQKRWMINSFAHYQFAPRIEGYAEFHFSNNSVTALLAPSNVNSTFLYNVNNVNLTPQMQALMGQLDAAETGTTCSGLISTICTTAGDGIVALASGRRFTRCRLPRQ